MGWKARTAAPPDRRATGIRLRGGSYGRHDRRNPAGAHRERKAAGGAGAGRAGHIAGLTRTLIVSADTELISGLAYLNAVRDSASLPAVNNYRTLRRYRR
jgi:hypothetical protein